MLRTFDWMNDACEASLHARHRPAGGVLTYDAIMSPIRVEISHRRRKARSVKWPVSVLITDQWLIVATKKRLGRRAWVHKFDRGAITAAAGQNPSTKCPGFEFLTEEELAVCNDLLPNAMTAVRY
jgi:hypothetical protein